MKLSTNINNILWKYPYEKCIKFIADAGFDAIDYSLDGMVKDDSPFNQDNYKKIAENIRKIANDAGLVINQTHAPFSFKTQIWNDNFEMVNNRINRSIEISGIFGADICVVHPLHHFTYHGHEEEIFEMNMDYYRKKIPLCKEYNVKAGIENMFQVDPRRKHIIHDTCSRKEEFIRYIDTLDSEYMVGLLDVGHAGLPLQDDEAEDFIKALGHDRLYGLHIHDNDYKSDSHIMPYMGKLNWKNIASALGKIDYRGDFTYEAGFPFFENCDEEFIPTAVKFTEQIGRHLCNIVERERIKK